VATKPTKTAAAKGPTKASAAKGRTKAAAAKSPTKTTAKKTQTKASTTKKPAKVQKTTAGAKAAPARKPTKAAKPATVAKKANSAARTKAADATSTPKNGKPADAVAANSGSAIKRKRPAPIRLPKGYQPTESEEFMSRRQQEYFRQKLLVWREEIIGESRETIIHLQQHSPQEPDLADRASIETDRLIELRTRDRERKLLSKIDEALERIEDGSYGYCEETGEPISLKRLEARPIATLSIDAQERHERLEKIYRDD